MSAAPLVSWHSDNVRVRGLSIWMMTVVVGAGCSSVECESSADCPSGQLCDGLNTCYDPGTSRGRRDAGPVDAASPSDSGPQADADTDAGPNPDAGPAQDAGPQDAGATDGGGPVDGGPVTPAVGSRGLVWAGELRSGGVTEYHAYAELLDESTGTYTRMAQTIPDLEQGNCTVTTQKLTAGAPTGYVADSITIAPGNPMAPSNFAYLAVGNGRFEPPAPPPMRMFSQSNGVLFGIVGTGSPDSIETTDFVRTEAPPIIFEQMPVEGGTVILAGGPTVAWGMSGGPSDIVTIEAYDAGREVILSCKTQNDQSYSVPVAAVGAFMSQGPTRPFTFEIRHDREVVGQAVAEGRSFEVLYRASWGARFPAL